MLLHILKPLTKAVIDRAPALRLIQKIGVGVNTIDLVAARARRIAVATMRGTNTQAVAETALLLMLAALRNRYRAGATPYPGRSRTGWIAPVDPGASETAPMI